MSGYSVIDPIIDRWVAKLGTVLFTEWADAPARFFYLPGDPPFECFQVSVAVPEGGRVSVLARAVDTNDDTEDLLTRTWTVPIEEFDGAMKAAIETVDVWRSRRREKPDPPSPWT